MAYDIFLVNADGAGLGRIVNGSGGEDLPRFSEGGDRIIFRRLDQFAAGAGEGESGTLVAIAIRH